MTGRVHGPLASRFWPKVNKNGRVVRAELGPCWEWTARTNDRGYGWFNPGGRPELAHRVSWSLAHGADPGDTMVLHRCDNPPCVNPAHLFLGDGGDNMRDMAAKGRWRRGPLGQYSPRLSPEQKEQAMLALSNGERASVIAARMGVSAAQVRRLRRVHWEPPKACDCGKAPR